MRLSLFKRSNGYWYLRISTKDSIQQISTKCKLKSDALEFLRNFKESSLDSIKVKKAIFDFIVYRRKTHSYKTMKGYIRSLERFQSFLGERTIKSLTRKDIIQFQADTLSKRSIFQAKKDRAAVSTFLTYCVENNYLELNPCYSVRGITLPVKLPLFLTKDQFKKMLENCSDNDFKDLIIIAVSTGLRLGELRNLTWKQVNLENKKIAIDNQRFLSKSRKPRTVALNSVAMEVLKNRKHFKDYVFYFADGDDKVSERTIEDKIKKLYKVCDLDPKLNFHSLRHTFASWLVQAGVQIQIVQELLGHSDIRTTEIYVHLTPENHQEAVEEIAINN